MTKTERLNYAADLAGNLATQLETLVKDVTTGTPIRQEFKSEASLLRLLRQRLLNLARLTEVLED